MQRPPTLATSEGVGYNHSRIELTGLDKPEANATSSWNVSNSVTTPASFSDNEALYSALVETSARDAVSSTSQSFSLIQHPQASVAPPTSEEHSLAPLLLPVNRAVESLCEERTYTAVAVRVATELTPGAKSVINSTSKVQGSTVVTSSLSVDPILPSNCPMGGEVDSNIMNQDSKSLMNLV